MTWVKLNDGVTIELQPHQDALLQLANPRSVPENEPGRLSATRGSTISSSTRASSTTSTSRTASAATARSSTRTTERCEGVAIQDADVPRSGGETTG